MTVLNQQGLRELLIYDPDTGIFTWKVTRSHMTGGKVAGRLNTNGYVRIGIRNKYYYAHQLAWLYVHGEWAEAHVDHINGVRSDNRLLNLRPATSVQNSANVGIKANNTSGVKGVCWHKRAGKWRAQIKKGPRNVYLGLFTDINEAKAVYDAEARAFYGEFARTP